ncbi:LytTR family transcriptional regulator [Rhodophyticola sp. CCM32]|uniref:LytTR family DNA-binding domain-containing protein n=1 Tax=Rhodophyticola sp. CCM32 TaxID=2916397 RepID=UPI00107F69F2|nr:LytTR family DNA-binding domain-containing protein [Rhodophyticola sp. CCM32]QBY01198.1 LytTR family transcriptional regulator [Rhodophyticola sp. CCM32]
MQTNSSDLRVAFIHRFGSSSFSVWVAASVLATLLGPFGTYSAMSLLDRGIYWGGLIGVSILFAGGIKAMVQQVFPAKSFAVDLLSSGIMAVVLGMLIWAYNHFVYGVPSESLPSIFAHMIVVLMICLTLVLIRMYLEQESEDSAADNASDAAEEVAFLRRLPPELGRDLMHISADGHYLEVVTSQGEDRLLLRFSDAMDELDGYDGVRIHRSHWVALNAISGVEQKGRRTFIILSQGIRLPVSQGYQDALIDRGIPL